VALRICEPQCITSLIECLRVQFRMSTAPVYGCHIYVCKIIAFGNFQEIKNILLLLCLLKGGGCNEDNVHRYLRPASCHSTAALEYNNDE